MKLLNNHFINNLGKKYTIYIYGFEGLWIESLSNYFFRNNGSCYHLSGGIIMTDSESRYEENTAKWGTVMLLEDFVTVSIYSTAFIGNYSETSGGAILL